MIKTTENNKKQMNIELQITNKRKNRQTIKRMKIQKKSKDEKQEGKEGRNIPVDPETARS